MKILVIEDDLELNAAIKASLEKQGYAVDGINDGEKGERHIEINHQDYDLIILDLMLPQRDGFEVCRNIRALGILTPILILTGRDDVNDKILALDLGADDYLTKPFSFEELSARVRALLRRPKEALTPDLTVADLALNTSTRKVTCNGKEVPLTLKEFSLLEYLMRHPNQVINRDQILDHVWDFEFNSFSNIVDVHINNLRKKLKVASKKNYLESVRGVGYRLKP